MAAMNIRDLAYSHALDRAAMSGVRGAGGNGAWVAGWIIPFTGVASAGHGGDIYHITNNFSQTIIASQATFQTQTTEVFNSGANALLNVGPGQSSATARF